MRKTRLVIKLNVFLRIPGWNGVLEWGRTATTD